MSVAALELLVVILAGSLLIVAVWQWMVRRVDREHHRHVHRADDRVVHELEHREGRP